MDGMQIGGGESLEIVDGQYATHKVITPDFKAGYLWALTVFKDSERR